MEKKQKMLLIVDPQYDFLEGGKLGVNGATDTMNRLVEHIDKNEYDVVIITCDWHPHNHISFKTWNPHCIQFTHGASIYEPLYDVISKKVNNFHVLTKGNFVNKEEYSIMDNYESSKKLIRFIETLNVSQIDVCGIASEYCVLESVQGLVEAKQTPKLNVLLSFIAKMESHDKLIEYCSKKAVRCVQ